MFFKRKLFDPSKVIAVGLNYRDHAAELKMPIPASPVLFIKPRTSVIGDGDNIVYPPQVRELHYEAELAVVIGKTAKNVDQAKAAEYIAGYTCGNDVTARDQQRTDGQWTRSKSYDTFCPIGPRLARGIDPNSLAIKLYLNGQLKQSSNTSQMIFKVDELVSFISGIMTLLPGDVILTGTPVGVGEMRRGDVVVVEIEGIGKLTNKVM
jgi:2-keto-4-pentenoate hydratase/2-oxohepta-3-ene-1,7-dioic acid hydratase in catechol pathway